MHVHHPAAHALGIAIGRTAAAAAAAVERAVCATAAGLLDLLARLTRTTCPTVREAAAHV